MCVCVFGQIFIVICHIIIYYSDKRPRKDSVQFVGVHECFL